MTNKYKNLKKQILDKIFNLIGVVGILLIIYGAFTNWFLSKWPPIESLSSTFSVYSTLFATLITTISIYIPTNNSNPKEFSKYLSAPIIIVCLIIATFYT